MMQDSETVGTYVAKLRERGEIFIDLHASLPWRWTSMLDFGASYYHTFFQHQFVDKVRVCYTCYVSVTRVDIFLRACFPCSSSHCPGSTVVD